jgi:serine/threonine-protein kinase
VAVLPFVNLGTGPSEDAISDGLTEDIITALARTRNLKVPSRTTVWQYKGRVVDARQVGRSLGVRAVLEGSVRRSGDNVRIAAQLIGVSDGFHLWAGSFDRKADRALELQREVAGLLAEGLRERLAENSRRNQAGRAAPDGDAQRAFLEAYQNFNMDEIRNEWGAGGRSAKLTATMQGLERATKLDPNFSAGWAGLAETTEFAAVLDARNRKAYRDQAEAAARKALELEPTNALALTTLASVYSNHDWNLKQAEPYLRRAVESSPHSTGITADYANLLASLGRVAEAEELLESSQLLEPASARPSGRLAVLKAMRGDSTAARRYATASLSRDPRNRHAQWALGRADDLDGNVVSAEQRYRQVLERYPTEDRTLASLGHMLARVGRRDEAMEIARKLHAMVEQNRRRETFEALVRTGLGEKNEALTMIEQAWQLRDPNVLNIELEIRFRPLASEPRFQAVAQLLRGLR